MNKGKVITVYPIVAGNGAKFIATNMAHVYKRQNPNEKVILVDLNLKHPFLAESLTAFDEIHGVDNLVDKIDGNMLTNELFMENMVSTKGNVDVLKGTKMLGKYKVLNPTHVTTILDFARTLYDVVFVAVASESDNAGTVVGLFESDEIVMVARQNQASLKMIYQALDIVNQYKQTENSIKLVYNYYQSTGLDVSEVVKAYQMEVLGLVEYDVQATDNLDLLTTTSSKFFKQRNVNNEVLLNMVKKL